MTKLTDLVIETVKSTYYEMNSEEAESARERGQRIRRARERVIQSNPGYKKIIEQLKSKGDIEKYGIPVGAEPVDNEEGYDEDEEVREPRSGKQMIFDYTAIGGDQSRGGKTKFRLWLENTFIEGSPDLKKAVDGVSGKKKRNMMIRISYMVRRSIAEKGLQPGATARMDDEGNTEEIFYGSGKSWKSTYPKGGYK